MNKLVFKEKEILQNFPINGRKSTNLHIYCPENEINKISEILTDNNIYVDFNHLGNFEKKSHKFLPFASKKLDDNIKKYLIQKIKHGDYVRPLIDYLEDYLNYTPIELMDSDYFFYHSNFSSLRKPRLWVLKRITDLIYASVLSIIFLPISCLVALLIKLDSKGPVFYRQDRIGKFNKPFRVVKFRSMQVDAEKNGALWACENDKRITRVGNWIRKLRLDEVPQLINVFKGDMSLIGPRPERNEFISELERHIPYYRFRHAIKPGLTGWAQVNYPYGASINDASWKHRYDMYYINKQSFILDFRIICKTVKVMLFGMGR